MAEDLNKSPSLGNNSKAEIDAEIPAKCGDSATETNPEVNDDIQLQEAVKSTEKTVENREDSKGNEITKKVNDTEEIESKEDVEMAKEAAESSRRASNEVLEKSSLSIVQSTDNLPEISKKSEPSNDSLKQVDSVTVLAQKNTSDSRESEKNPEEDAEECSGDSKIVISNSAESNKAASQVVEENEETPRNPEETDDPEEVVEEDVQIRKTSERNVRDVEEDENVDEDDAEVVDEEEEETEDERLQETSEVGIVGPPTAVRDIINDEELGTTESSSLPNDNRNDTSGNDAADVAEWIEKSRRSNGTSEPLAPKIFEKTTRRRKKSSTEGTAPNSGLVATRKSQRIITSIIRRSIKCLNKMHAAVEYGSGGGTSGKKVETTEKREEDARGSPKVPQSRQNGAALPEETATAIATSGSTSERLCPIVKHENLSDTENDEQSMQIDCTRRRSVEDNTAATSRNSNKTKSTATNVRIPKSERENTRKRRSTEENFSGNCNPFGKKICFEQRERLIDSLVGTSERVTADELASRADELRAEVQALDEMARAKEMEWNEILSMRKLKEEAYLRIERRRQVVGFMESNGDLPENLPPASLSLIPEWESTSQITNASRGSLSSTLENESIRESKETTTIDSRLLVEINPDIHQRSDDNNSEKTNASNQTRKENKTTTTTTTTATNVSLKSSSNSTNNQRRTSSPKQISENGRKQQQRNQQQAHNVESQPADNRQIGEGRQGPIVDVRSIIADYRLRHPESVPRRYDNNDCPARIRQLTTTRNTTSGFNIVRRGRRMRNSVNIGLGAGGAMVETTNQNVDSRPSSTDSCKSNPNPSLDPNNSMSFKDVLVQFAKLSQQQGEPVKTPQNYPDVTLHPVAPTPITQNSNPTTQQQQNSGSLLHGILTKSQSPRPTTFSPTLARLLTAPERERNTRDSANPPATSNPQNTQTQHLLQTYQGSNPVSITDLLSSSKARTEITITPVVNPVTPIHASNNLVNVDDVEEDSSLIDERDSRINSGARDNRDERDSPPRCQGCQERAAQFVCAGCGNQWYCSRECQVAAWDEHSEVCSG